MFSFPYESWPIYNQYIYKALQQTLNDFWQITHGQATDSLSWTDSLVPTSNVILMKPESWTHRISFHYKKPSKTLQKQHLSLQFCPAICRLGGAAEGWLWPSCIAHSPRVIAGTFGSRHVAALSVPAKLRAKWVALDQAGTLPSDKVHH